MQIYHNIKKSAPNKLFLELVSHFWLFRLIPCRIPGTVLIATKRQKPPLERSKPFPRRRLAQGALLQVTALLVMFLCPLLPTCIYSHGSSPFYCTVHFKGIGQKLLSGCLPPGVLCQAAVRCVTCRPRRLTHTPVSLTCL